MHLKCFWAEALLRWWIISYNLVCMFSHPAMVCLRTTDNIYACASSKNDTFPFESNHANSYEIAKQIFSHEIGLPIPLFEGTAICSGVWNHRHYLVQSFNPTMHFSNECTIQSLVFVHTLLELYISGVMNTKNGIEFTLKNVTLKNCHIETIYSWKGIYF